MKKVFTLSLALSLLFITGVANAQTQSAGTICVNMTVRTSTSDNPFTRATCQVGLPQDMTHLNGTWTCSFNGGQTQSLKTTATWITDPADNPTQTVFYDFEPGQDLGDFLFQGFGLKDTKLGATVEIDLGDKPRAKYDMELMLGDVNWNWNYLKIVSVQNGACAF